MRTAAVPSFLSHEAIKLLPIFTSAIIIYSMINYTIKYVEKATRIY